MMSSFEGRFARRSVSSPPVLDTPEGIRATIHRLVKERLVYPVFQPVVNLAAGHFYGYEGLIRPLPQTGLQSPLQLLAAAHEFGLAFEVEHLALETVANAFVARELPGRLFINISPSALLACYDQGHLLSEPLALGLEPEQVVLELTTGYHALDILRLQTALLHCRQQGFGLALDDMGEGFASLKLWAQLRPNFIKIHHFFIRDVDRDPIKLQMVKSIVDIAQVVGCTVLAEGVETEAELAVVRQLGINFVQGYLFAAPSRNPAPQPIGQHFQQVTLSLSPSGSVREEATAIDLLRPVEPVLPDTPNDLVLALLNHWPELRALPVVDAQGHPVGLIHREVFMDSFSRPFRHELYGKRPCSLFMDAWPLIIPHDLPLSTLSEQMLQEGEQRYLNQGFIITRDGEYLGMGTGHELMRQVTEWQLSAARHANPLTFLPGNVAINAQIDKLLAAKTPFYVCYADLDHFKAYNDVYGYRKGDALIQLAAKILQNHCQLRGDFVGHIGGDDFVLLWLQGDWEARCRTIVAEFARQIPALFTAEHVLAGGYEAEDRQGRRVKHPLVSLSLGVLAVAPGQYHNPDEIASAATEAKKHAKQRIGNSYFLLNSAIKLRGAV